MRVADVRHAFAPVRPQDSLQAKVASLRERILKERKILEGFQALHSDRKSVV